MIIMYVSTIPSKDEICQLVLLLNYPLRKIYLFACIDEILLFLQAEFFILVRMHIHFVIQIVPHWSSAEEFLHGKAHITTATIYIILETG
jgi:hypothetical protein